MGTEVFTSPMSKSNISDEDVQTIKSIFEHYDADGNGTLDYQKQPLVSLNYLLSSTILQKKMKSKLFLLKWTKMAMKRFSLKNFSPQFPNGGSLMPRAHLPKSFRPSEILIISTYPCKFYSD